VSETTSSEAPSTDDATAAAAAASASGTTAVAGANIAGASNESNENTDNSVPEATALSRAGAQASEEFMKGGKVIVFFKATGNAPQLKVNKFKLSASARFASVGDFLRKQLRCGANDALFLFINCTFQPAPDEIVADLFRCFHNNGKLVVNYCTTPAWG
jgi:ubiquitin-like protein ATG12